MSPSSKQDRADALFDGPDWSREPGAVAAVLEGGDVVWWRCFGLAHIGAGRQLTPTTRMRVASLTKPMFALVVAALVEAGKLDLADPLQKFVPELALPHASLEQLLAMKSGIRDPDPLTWLALGGGVPHAIEARQTFALQFAQDGVGFAPGERTLYANINYLLAQLAIERLTSEPCGALLKRYVFGPANMTDSVLADGPAHVLRDAALAYAHEDGVFSPADPDRAMGASGAVVSTLDDMARFYRWLRGDPYEWLTRLAAPMTHQDGSPSWYARGFGVQTLSGARAIGHSGNLGGWSCDSLWAPEPDVAAIVLGNRNDINWYERTRELLVTWADLPPDAGATPRLIRPTPPEPLWKEDFGSEEAGWSLRLQGAADELVLEGRRMPRGTDGRFRRTLGVEPIELDPAGDPATPPAQVVRREGNVTTRFLRADPAGAIDDGKLVGTYVARTMPAPIVVARDDRGRLRLGIGAAWPAKPRWLLRHIVGDLYRGFEAEGDAPTEVHIRFERRDDGWIEALTLSTSRLVRYRYDRVADDAPADWPERIERAPALLPWRPE